MDLSALGRHNRLCLRRPGQRKVRPGRGVWARQPTQSFKVRGERLAAGPGRLTRPASGKRKEFADAAPRLRSAGQQPPGTKLRAPLGSREAESGMRGEPPQRASGEGPERRSRQVRRCPAIAGDGVPDPSGVRDARSGDSARPLPGGFRLEHPKRPVVTGKSSQAGAGRPDAAKNTRTTVAAGSQS